VLIGRLVVQAGQDAWLMPLWASTMIATPAPAKI
jgi:hypothetical protein